MAQVLTPIVITPRSAAILCTPKGTRFTQKEPVIWQLCEEKGGKIVGEGEATTAALFFEDLTPDTPYRLTTTLGAIVFATRDCAGLVRASEHGVSTRTADNAAGFAAAIAATPEGGTLLVETGLYATGPIFLKPHMTLHVRAGATIAAVGSREGWPILPAHDPSGRVIGTWEGLPEAAFAAVVTGLDCDGLAITGGGTIDGGGDRGDWWQWPKDTREGARRPRTIHIAHSDVVSLSGVTVCNSPSWTVHPYRCTDFTAAALRIENPDDSPNTDGLNPESCEGVEIAGVAFTVGDDCIAIKAGKRGPGQVDHLSPTKRVRVRHCLMQKGHGAVVLGSEMSGGIEDVLIEACDFDGTDRGLRIKTRRGRGGMVQGVTFSDVVMEAVPVPLAINAFYFCDPDGKSDAVQSRGLALVDETTPRISGITFQNVTATRVAYAAAAVLGLPEAEVRDVVLTNYRVSFDPAAEPGVPLMACEVEPVRHEGVVAQFAEVTGAPHVLEADHVAL